MANELSISYSSGRTLTADQYSNVGVVKEADITLTEVSTTGIYLGDATLSAGDIVRISDSIDGYLKGFEYQPTPSSLHAITDAKIDAKPSVGGWMP